jgi:hypothetical protein
VIRGPLALLVLDLIGGGALAAALIYAAVLWRRGPRPHRRFRPTA